MYVKIGSECESCNLLRELLAEARTDNRRLMDKLLVLTNPVAREIQEVIEPGEAPIKPLTWKMRRAMLEDEDRKKAELERKKKDELKNTTLTVEELEHELGVEENVQ